MRTSSWTCSPRCLTPRDARGVRYSVMALLAIAILATAAGMRSYAGPRPGAHRSGARARRAGGAVPAAQEETFRSLLMRLDAADQDRRLGAYFTGLAAADGGLLPVALDGKTVRGAPRARGRAAHLVSVFATTHGWSSGSSPSPTRAMKYLRAKASPPVRSGAAAGHGGCDAHAAGHPETDLRNPESHYLMIVKANQKSLLARVEALPWAQVPLTHADPPEQAHRPDRTRTLKTLTVARGIGFPYLRQVVEITRERLVIVTGVRTVEVVYAICSVAFEQARHATIAAWLRPALGHRELSVHWARDVTFDEDRSTVRAATAPQRWQPCATPRSTSTASQAPTTSPKPLRYKITLILVGMLAAGRLVESAECA